MKHIILLSIALTGLALGQQTFVNGKGGGITDAPAFRTALGLGNVDNTSDANKPVSTLQAAAIAAAEADANAFSIQRANHTGTQAHTTITGLGTAATTDSTAYDPAGSAATAQAAAIANAIQRANHTGTQAIATVSGLQAALDAKLNLSGGTMTGDLLLGGFDITGADEIVGARFYNTGGNPLYAPYNLTIAANGGFDANPYLRFNFGADHGRLTAPADLSGTPIWTLPATTGTVALTSDLTPYAPLASPTFTGDATFDTNTLFVDSITNRVGIGTITPAYALEVRVGAGVNYQAYLGRDGFGYEIGRSDIDGYLKFRGDQDFFSGYQFLNSLGTSLLHLANDGTITTSGGIELGSATDTTLSRSAAGKLAVEGDIVSTLAADETHSGDRNLTGAVTIANQDTSVATSAVNIGMVQRLRHFQANSISDYRPYNLTLATGGGLTENTNYTRAILGADTSSIGKVMIGNWGLGVQGSGDTWSYAIPWVLSGRITPFTTNEFVNVRIQTGVTTSKAVPLKGSDPIAAEDRGIGIEFRKKPSDDLLEVRIYARDGYTGTSGTFIASTWTSTGIAASNSFRSSIGYVLDFIQSTGTVNLYLSASDSNVAARANRISSTPLISLSGTGVPTDYAYDEGEDSNIIAFLVPDGANSPAGGCGIIAFPHIFEIK